MAFEVQLRFGLDEISFNIVNDNDIELIKKHLRNNEEAIVLFPDYSEEDDLKESKKLMTQGGSIWGPSR